jgi:hypothetical protein
MVMLGVVVACSHNEPKPATPPPPAASESKVADTPAAAEADPAPCNEVAQQSIRLSRTSGDTKTVTEMMRRRCSDDRWSLEVRRCLLLANTWDEGLACESKFTEAQKKALDADIRAQGSTMAHPAPQP